MWFLTLLIFFGLGRFAGRFFWNVWLQFDDENDFIKKCKYYLENDASTDLQADKEVVSKI